MLPWSLIRLFLHFIIQKMDYPQFRVNISRGGYQLKASCQILEGLVPVVMTTHIITYFDLYHPSYTYPCIWVGVVFHLSFTLYNICYNVLTCVHSYQSILPFIYQFIYPSIYLHHLNNNRDKGEDCYFHYMFRFNVCCWAIFLTLLYPKLL